MSRDAMFPCFSCGKALQNVFEESTNQPAEATSFQTYGHYGSTFWDSFNGEELVLNICDACLRTWKDRLGRHKRYRQVIVLEKVGNFLAHNVVGRAWIDREMVPYFEGDEDDDPISIEPEEIGTLEGYNIEWVPDWQRTKKRLLAKEQSEEEV